MLICKYGVTHSIECMEDRGGGGSNFEGVPIVNLKFSAFFHANFVILFIQPNGTIL